MKSFLRTPTMYNELSATMGDSRSDALSHDDIVPAMSSEVDEFSRTDEAEGAPGSDPEKQGLMHSVLEADEDTMDVGNMVLDSLSNNASFFTPDLLMEKLVQDYARAEQLYGEALIRRLTGYDPSYVARNVNIPEFRRELEKRVEERFAELQQQGFLERDGTFSDEALELATIVLAVQELDHLESVGVLGERVHKRRSVDGVREATKPFTDDPYRSLNIAQSVKTALRRGHQRLLLDDLRAFEREARGRASIVYAVDVSGSMKGEKIAQAKRAGVALSFKAVRRGDLVGLLGFGKEVELSVLPTRDFRSLLRPLVGLRTGRETDIAGSIRFGVTMFRGPRDSKHLILLSDALPTIGSEDDVLSAVAEARAAGVVVSLIGIALDDAGERLARRIVDVGGGRLRIARDVAELDVIVLEEYERVVK